MATLPPDFVATANQRHTESRTFLHNWQTEARDSFAFVAGHQWLDEDVAVLQEQKRPTITFNYSEKMIDAVVGAEVSNRQEITYRPREVTDAAASELINNAAKWVRDECNAEDEETDAFRDALICGLGWTHTRMTYDEDLDGRIAIDRIDPLEMSYDPASTKPGLSDRRYHFKDWWVDKREAMREWPNAYEFASEDENTAKGVITHGNRYSDDQHSDPDIHKDQVQIRFYECWERRTVYRIASGQDFTELTPSEFNKVKADLDAAGTQYVKQQRKVYYQAYFAGETLLEGAESPCQKGFLINCITAKRDRNSNTWYGLTRVMMDPQRWANKWLSQVLHIINSNAKGGLLAETGAFVDPKKAQDEWAMPESITLLNEGGINKIKEKGMAQFPSGLDRLMEFALNSLPMVTGINLEALGLANREQAGVLEQQRKQAAYGLLSPLFDSLRRYRKNHGRVLLSMIHDFISDGRMIRIGGPESEQFLPLIRTPGMQTYDVFVDSSPNAPDVKDKTWSTLMAILPAMMKAGLPIPPNLLDYTPLPVALSTKWKQYIAEQEQNKGPSPEQLQQMQQQMQKATQENEQLKSALKDKTGELQLKAKEAEAEFSLKERTFLRDTQLKLRELEVKIELERKKQDDQHRLAQEQVDNDTSTKVLSMVRDTTASNSMNEINDTISALRKAIEDISNEE